MSFCDFFFINDLHLTPERLLPKSVTQEAAIDLLQSMIMRLDEKEDWAGSTFETASHEVAEHFNVHHKKVMMPLLFATIMGKDHGPPLYDSVTILGKDRSRVRLMQAIEVLGGVSNKRLDALKKEWEKRSESEFCNSLLSRSLQNWN